MKNIEEIKNELFSRIKEKQALLLECDVRGEKYSILLNELELLNLEYKEVSSIKANNFVRKIEEYKKLKEKYDFLTDLDMNQLYEILITIRQTNKLVRNAYDNGIEFTEITNDFKQELLINNIDYTKIKNSEILEKIIKLLTKKYENFKKDLEEFYSLLRNFSPSNYEILASTVKKQAYLSINVLTELRNQGSDTLIDAILKNYENKQKIKTEQFILPKKREEMLEKTDKKIREYTNTLYNSIGLLIKQNYKDYKSKLGLTIDEFYEKDILDLYSKILKQIADKNTEIKTIIQSYKSLLKTYKALEESNDKKFKSLGLNMISIEEKKINIYDLTKEDILEILSKINTYNNLQIEITKEETPKLILATEE